MRSSSKIAITASVIVGAGLAFVIARQGACVEQPDESSELAALTASECEEIKQGCDEDTRKSSDCNGWLGSADPRCIARYITCQREYEKCIGRQPTDAAPGSSDPPDGVDDPTATSQCTGQPVGADPGEGECQNYWCGGSSGVHFYTCCNFPRGSACDDMEFDGASGGDYCGSNGENNGAGRAWGQSWPIGPDGCDLAKECHDVCSLNPLTVPGTCFSYTICFNKCMGMPRYPTTTGGGGGTGEPAQTMNQFRPEEQDYSMCGADDAPADCTCPVPDAGVPDAEPEPTPTPEDTPTPTPEETPSPEYTPYETPTPEPTPSPEYTPYGY
jgi:hypothetical protein